MNVSFWLVSPSVIIGPILQEEIPFTEQKEYFLIDYFSLIDTASLGAAADLCQDRNWSVSADSLLRLHKLPNYDSFYSRDYEFFNLVREGKVIYNHPWSKQCPGCGVLIDIKIKERECDSCREMVFCIRCQGKRKRGQCASVHGGKNLWFCNKCYNEQLSLATEEY